MHGVIEEGLEDYLRGSANREVLSHLANCEGCRKEVGQIEELSALFGALRNEIDIAPSLGFSQRVMRRVQEDKGRSFWNVFSVDPGFARKIALASLLSLAALGSYLATAPADSSMVPGGAPEAVLASHDVNSPDVQQHQDGMLVTLATYHQ